MFTVPSTLEFKLLPNPKTIPQVARLVENDVAAIDINMGCPKGYSTKFGGGAALLQTPDLIKDILTTLVSNIKTISITCKIRCLRSIEDTVELAKMIESTGVNAIGVHGRFKEERPREPAHYEYIKAVKDALSIPVIANGGSLDIKTYADLAKFREHTGCDSIMLARIAQWNPSIFSKDGPVEAMQMARDYLRLAATYDNTPSNVKYCIQQYQCLPSEIVREIHHANSIKELFNVFNIVDEYTRISEELMKKSTFYHPRRQGFVIMTPEVFAAAKFDQAGINGWNGTEVEESNQEVGLRNSRGYEWEMSFVETCPLTEI